MANHTPTPWAIWDNELIVEACSDEWIADTICNVRALKENGANAAFIVRAVNNHETLVEVLRNIRQGYSGTLRQHDLDAIDAALQRARG